MSTIETLKNERANVEAKLYEAFIESYKTDQNLQDAILVTDLSNDYRLDQYGEIVRVTSISLPTDPVAKQAFSDYLSEHCIYVDWDAELLCMSEGDALTIQTDTRRDNGVYMSHKCVIPESEYKVDGEVCETTRNALIEDYMEKTGYYPGVFRIDYDGNVYPVNTQKKESA